MNTTEDECARCGSTLVEVRPGKWQCTKCELDQMVIDQYNNGYQAGLTQAQADDDGDFWLRQYAGIAMQGLLVGVDHPRFENIATLAVKQAKALLEEINRQEDV